jgi:hypothetical protein
MVVDSNDFDISEQAPTARIERAAPAAVPPVNRQQRRVHVRRARPHAPWPFSLIFK